MPTDTTDDVPEVELLETSGSGLSEEVSNEPLARPPLIGGTALVLLAAVVIVIGLVLIPRTVPDVPAQTTSQTTAPTTSLPDQANGAVSGRQSTTVVTQAIPLLFDASTPDVPGVLSGIDIYGSLIVIDRTLPRPNETRLGMTLAAGDPVSTLILDGAGPIPVASELGVDGADIIVSHRDGRFLEPSFSLTEIAPDLDVNAVLISHERDGQLAVAVPLTWGGVDRTSLLEWTLPGQGIAVLGVWGEQLVVHRADRVWLLDIALEATLVGEGRLLAYDGTHLSRLVCNGPTECSLVVGTPDEPAARTLPLPAAFAALDPDDWVGSVTVSPDGRRLATSVRLGAVSLPYVVDLETGETESLADGMNRQTPVAWSPDGEWVAYVFTDDVMVWNLAEQRSFRIQVNRQLETLLWR